VLKGQLSKQDQWLRQDQINEFEIIKKREADRKEQEAKNKANEPKGPKEFFLDERSILNSLRLSPDEKFIAFRVLKRAEGNKTPLFQTISTQLDTLKISADVRR